MFRFKWCMQNGMRYFSKSNLQVPVTQSHINMSQKNRNEALDHRQHHNQHYSTFFFLILQVSFTATICNHYEPERLQKFLV